MAEKKITGRAKPKKENLSYFAAKPPFRDDQCAECKRPMMIRPDRLPLCIECEKKIRAMALKKVPKLVKQGRTEIQSSAVTGDHV